MWCRCNVLVPIKEYPWDCVYCIICPQKKEENGYNLGYNGWRRRSKRKNICKTNVNKDESHWTLNDILQYTLAHLNDKWKQANGKKLTLTVDFRKREITVENNIPWIYYIRIKFTMISHSRWLIQFQPVTAPHVIWKHLIYHSWKHFARFQLNFTGTGARSRVNSPTLFALDVRFALNI